MKNKLVRQSLAFAGALAAGLMLVPDAEAVSFNLGSSAPQGNVSSLDYTQGGLGLQVNAFADKTPQAFVFQDNAGLGVKRAPQDFAQIDGAGVSEFLRLNFDRAVRLVSVSFSSVERRTGALVSFDGGELFRGKTDFQPGGLASISFASRPQGTYFDFTGLNSGDHYLLSSVEVEPVPEPITILGTGLALAAGVAFERKRSQSKRA